MDDLIKKEKKERQRERLQKEKNLMLEQFIILLSKLSAVTCENTQENYVLILHHYCFPQYPRLSLYYRSFPLHHIVFPPSKRHRQA